MPSVGAVDAPRHPSRFIERDLRAVGMRQIDLPAGAGRIVVACARPGGIAGNGHHVHPAASLCAGPVTPKSRSLGAVWTPNNHLRLSVDYIDIGIKNEIRALTVPNILFDEAACRQGGEATYRFSKTPFMGLWELNPRWISGPSIP